MFISPIMSNHAGVGYQRDPPAPWSRNVLTAKAQDRPQCAWAHGQCPALVPALAAVSTYPGELGPRARLQVSAVRPTRGAGRAARAYTGSATVGLAQLQRVPSAPPRSSSGHPWVYPSLKYRASLPRRCCCSGLQRQWVPLEKTSEGAQGDGTQEGGTYPGTYLPGQTGGVPFG